MSKQLSSSGSAVVNVGDEILLGEMSNGNQRWMLATLQEHGLPAAVALSVPDDPASIARWLRLLREAGHAPVFVSGGIGGTHDDHTREGIARALERPLTRHEACFEILARKYGARFNAQRQRMAQLPQGCELIANPLGAPGFHVDGIYAFPGFPTMLQPMMLEVLARRSSTGTEAPWVTEEHVLPCAEGEIAREVEAFALAHPHARVGIYPSTEQLGQRTTLRIRCAPSQPETLASFRQLVDRLRS